MLPEARCRTSAEFAASAVVLRLVACTAALSTRPALSRSFPQKLGEERYSKAKCRGEVQLAVQRFLPCDWSRMAMWDAAVVSRSGGRRG